jgi:hypothetical protein
VIRRLYEPEENIEHKITKTVAAAKVYKATKHQYDMKIS